MHYMFGMDGVCIVNEEVYVAGNFLFFLIDSILKSEMKIAYCCRREFVEK